MANSCFLIIAFVANVLVFAKPIADTATVVGILAPPFTNPLPVTYNISFRGLINRQFNPNCPINTLVCPNNPSECCAYGLDCCGTKCCASGYYCAGTSTAPTCCPYSSVSTGNCASSLAASCAAKGYAVVCSSTNWCCPSGSTCAAGSGCLTSMSSSKTTSSSSTTRSSTSTSSATRSNTSSSITSRYVTSSSITSRSVTSASSTTRSSPSSSTTTNSIITSRSITISSSIATSSLSSSAKTTTTAPVIAGSSTSSSGGTSFSSPSKSGFWTPATIGGVSGGAAGLLIMIIIAMCCWHHQRQKEKLRKRNHNSFQSGVYGTSEKGPETAVYDFPEVVIVPKRERLVRAFPPTETEQQKKLRALLDLVEKRQETRRLAILERNRRLKAQAKKAAWRLGFSAVRHTFLHWLFPGGGTGICIAWDAWDAADAADVISQIQDLDDMISGLDNLPDADAINNIHDNIDASYSDMYSQFQNSPVAGVEVGHHYDVLFGAGDMTGGTNVDTGAPVDQDHGKWIDPDTQLPVPNDKVIPNPST